jgi:ATP-dependent DNA helicase RecG
MAPHLLSLSATPIPRTLALSLYSDLNISTLNEVPKGRQVIKTVVIDEAKRLIAYASIKKELKAGRQAFIVTPRVEEDDGSELKAAKAEFKILQQDNFKEYSVGLIYGGMKGEEKEKVMNEFYAKKIDVLVATSVIEIGIDVPNATIMLIEGSERFGLAQLHQLRGRVGRGIHQSYCLLMTSSDDEETLNRLQMFAQTNDGFKLAEIDLKERGFGSLFGTEQSGMNVKFPQYMTLKTLKLANQAAKEVLIEDPELALHPELDKVVRPLLEDMHLE